MAAKNKNSAKDPHSPSSVSNRRAHHEYDITDTYEAGLVLTGTEVKSLRRGRVNLADSFCVVEHGEVWVRNMHVSPYEQGNRYNVDAVRPRKLLLHNWQISRLMAQVREKGMSIIPTRLFFVRGRAKLQIGIGRGRKLYDRRDRIADRDRDREMRRELAARE
jgi:SsrA-binding protein